MRLSIRLAVLATLALAGSAHAYFDDTRTGARGAAIGPSAIAVVSDASSYYWNPAALSVAGRPEVLADYASVYGLSDVQVGSVAGAFHYRGTGIGLGWHHYGLRDVYSEDQLCLGAARPVLNRPSGHRVDLGATFKFGRAAFQPFTNPDDGRTLDLGAVSKGDFDLGVRWQTPWRVDLAWVARDVLQPRYEFVAGTGGQLMATRQEVAAAFRWNRESTLSVGWAQTGDGQTTLSTGLEITFYDVFAIRSGLANLSTIYQSYGPPENIQYQGGFGIYHQGYFVDAVATTSRELGASYRVTLRVPVGKGGGR